MTIGSKLQLKVARRNKPASSYTFNHNLTILTLSMVTMSSLTEIIHRASVILISVSIIAVFSVAVFHRLSSSRNQALGPTAFSKTLYFEILRLEVRVVSGSKLGETAYKMTIEQARELMASIKEACDSNLLRKFKIGTFTWTIDGSLRASGDDRITIRFQDFLIVAHERPRRADVLKAVAEILRRVDASLS
jgi:hypothetical protein